MKDRKVKRLCVDSLILMQKGHVSKKDNSLGKAKENKTSNRWPKKRKIKKEKQWLKARQTSIQRINFYSLGDEETRKSSDQEECLHVIWHCLWFSNNVLPIPRDES